MSARAHPTTIPSRAHAPPDADAGTQSPHNSDRHVIGVDIQKRSHTLVAVNSATGVQAGQRTIAASDAGHADALRFASQLGDEVVWALEDCRHVSGRLERALIAAGERVLRVWLTLMGTSRKGERQPGKSDPIDALAVARAVVRDGVENFPAAFLNEQAMESGFCRTIASSSSMNAPG